MLNLPNQYQTSTPRIGIPIPRDYFQREPLWGNAGGYRSVNEIVQAIEESGGEALLLFPGDEDTAIDGLVLPGGGDITPAIYGSEAGVHVDDTDEELDRFQLHLTRAALQSGLPMLGICRGMQVMNVAAGGTLIQHLEETESHFPLDAKENPDLRSSPVHSIDLEIDSHLGALLGEAKVAVNSLHHQATDLVPESLRIVATSHDGVVEALEGPGPYQVGVQFHPEDLRHTDGRFQGLFEGLVMAAS